MPHLYLSADAPLAPVREILPRYTELSGINLREDTQQRKMPDTISLALRTSPAGQPIIIHHTQAAPAAQFAHHLALTLAQLDYGAVTRAGAVSGRNPQVLLVLRQDTILDFNALARVIAHAAAKYFRLPELPQRPELPAALDGTGSAALRNFPSSASGMHHRIPPGASVSVLGRSGSWLLIRHRETVGFLPLSRVQF